MTKSRRDSCIEIWSDKYINNIKDRNSEDLNKEIIQIEPAGGDRLNFTVEVIKKGRPTMENDLISRNALKIALEYHKKPTDQACETERQWAVGYNAGLDRALYNIAYFPAVDAVPVVHGRWIGTEYDGYADGSPVYETWECSECREEHYGDCETLTAYCPYCGAKMDGKDDAK